MLQFHCFVHNDFIPKLSSGLKGIIEMSNHPVHIVNKNNQLQPSALIPFCSYGGNSNILGEQIGEFSSPVCTAFKPTLFRGRRCYSLNLNEHSVEENLTIRSGSSNGLAFLVDSNVDLHFGHFQRKSIDKQASLNDFRDKINNQNQIQIFIDAIEPYMHFGGGEIAMTGVKLIEGTKVYYDHAIQNKRCQLGDLKDNCLERYVTKKLIDDCNCAPFELLLLIKVSEFKVFFF